MVCVILPPPSTPDYQKLPLGTCPPELNERIIANLTKSIDKLQAKNLTIEQLKQRVRINSYSEISSEIADRCCSALAELYLHQAQLEEKRRYTPLESQHKLREFKEYIVANQLNS